MNMSMIEKDLTNLYEHIREIEIILNLRLPENIKIEVINGIITITDLTDILSLFKAKILTILRGNKQNG